MEPLIETVECHVFRAPIRSPVANAFGAMTNRPAVFLRVVASDGAWGWGEVFCNFPQVGAEHRARLARSIFGPLLAKASCRPDVVAPMLEQRTRRLALQCDEPGPFAQVAAAVDQALWDMAARRADVPLWRLLGGNSARVQVYASGLGPDDVVDAALRKRAEGYRAFKVKVGFGLDRDVANLRDMRAALGDATPIMTDANQAWEPEEAVRQLEALAPFAPHWIEEPIAADEPMSAWRGLAMRSAVPLAAGENIRGRVAFEQAIDSGALRFVQPDVGKWGGITGCREVALHAARVSVACCPHWLGGGVGLAASLHFIAAFGAPSSYAEVDANPNPLREAVCGMKVEEGEVMLGEAAGIGVEPDLRRLREFAVTY
jgi:L-alanine-DL-glutamate epimerase-like enolase superfamily enzyme